MPSKHLFLTFFALFNLKSKLKTCRYPKYPNIRIAQMTLCLSSPIYNVPVGYLFIFLCVLLCIVLQSSYQQHIINYGWSKCCDFWSRQGRTWPQTRRNSRQECAGHFWWVLMAWCGLSWVIFLTTYYSWCTREDCGQKTLLRGSIKGAQACPRWRTSWSQWA